MKIESCALSDIGRRREQNQDAYLIDEDLGLYIVCDGMGGHAAGDVAATNATRLTADFVRDHRIDIEEAVEKPGGHYKVVQMVTDCVRATCQMLHDMAVHSPECAGMGTTLTMLLIVGEKAILAHVGDSRLYLLRNGELHQMTNDHTLANELIQTGHIAPGSPEAERVSHVLTRCVGQQEFVDVETLLFDLLPNDRFLICSDGLSHYFGSDAEVAGYLTGDNLQQVADELVALANSRGGRDNITCLVLSATHDNPVRFQQSQTVLDALQSTFLCRGLTLNRRIRIANLGMLKSYDAGRPIIAQSDERNGMFVIIEGACQQTTPDGRTIELQAGESFGETGLTRGGQFRMQVRASERVMALYISRDDFQRLSRRIPKLGRRLLDNLLDRISFQYDELLCSAGHWSEDDE